VQRRAVLGALLLTALGVALGATVFRTDVARVKGLGQPPPPVREQNLDGNRSIRVHEQGRVVAAPAAPASPWSSYSGLSIGGNSDPVLADPSAVIDLTSLGASVAPGKLAYISLIVEYVSATGTNCNAASGGSIVYALDNCRARRRRLSRRCSRCVLPRGRRRASSAPPRHGRQQRRSRRPERERLLRELGGSDERREGPEHGLSLRSG
jgi:hypothetical protein